MILVAEVEVGLVVVEFWTEDTEEEAFIVEAWLEEAEVDVTIEDVAEEDVIIVLVVILECVLPELAEGELLPETLIAAGLTAEIRVYIDRRFEPPQSSVELPRHFMLHWLSAVAWTAVEARVFPHQHSLINSQPSILPSANSVLIQWHIGKRVDGIAMDRSTSKGQLESGKCRRFSMTQLEEPEGITKVELPLDRITNSNHCCRRTG